MDLITNRSAKDVERWKELRAKGWDGMTELERLEWLGEVDPYPAAAAFRGMYTHNDLNRVERAVEEIASRLCENGYGLTSVVTKTDWSYDDPFGIEDIKRYYSNIEKLRNAMVVYWNTPEAPVVENRLTYKIANDIETILQHVDEITLKLINSWSYVGDRVELGEVMYYGYLI